MMFAVFPFEPTNASSKSPSADCIPALKCTAIPYVTPIYDATK
jgi:hypothetical protein